MNEIKENEIREVEQHNSLSQEPILSKRFDSKLNLLKSHNVAFNFLDAGCIISVGCKEYAFSDYNVALEEFNNYVKDPAKVYAKWENL